MAEPVTAPPAAAPMSATARAVASLDRLLGPEVPADGPEAPAAPEAPAPAPEGTPPEGVPISEPPPADAPPEPAPDIDPAALTEEEAKSPQLQAIARREKRQRELHEARLAEVTKRETELGERAAKADKYEAIAKLAVENPVAFYKSLGIDKFADVAAQLYYEELGDAAPAEIKDQRKYKTLESQIAELRKERDSERASLAAEQKAAEDRRAVDSYRGQLGKFLGAVPEALPHVAAVAKAKPERVVDAMYRLAVGMMQADPDAGVPTADVLAKQLEASLKADAEVFRPIYAGSTQEKSPSSLGPQDKPAPRTLTNAQTQTSTHARSPAGSDQERIRRAAQALEAAEARATGR